MLRIIIVLGLFLLSFCTFAQISTPEKQKLNVGFYLGNNLRKFKPMISVDLSYKGSTLRLMPNYRYYSVGYTQELMKISPVYYNLYWTASVYGAYSFAFEELPSISVNEYKNTTYTYVVSTGLKSYFTTRMYTHVMAGLMVNNSMGVEELGIKKANEFLPYIEFGLGVNIFKNYPLLKPEEVEE